MADDRTVDDILGPQKEPVVSIEDIEKVTQGAKGNIKDPALAKRLKSAVEIKMIEDKANNRDTSKSKGIEIGSIEDKTNPNLQKEGQEQGE